MPEFKKYKLRAARSPHSRSPVASTVLVQNAAGIRSTCFIDFSLAFVQAIGKKLPRGVASFDPAYVSVVYSGRTKTWDVWARYLSDDIGALLWRAESLPSWLKLKSENIHGHSSPPNHTSSASRATKRPASCPETRQAYPR